MTELLRDGNHRTVAGGASSTNSLVVLPFKVDPVTNELLIALNSDMIMATPATVDKRDQNYRPTMYGISDDDGITLVPIRTDSNGHLLTE